MKEWIFSVCAISLITITISIILPQGKLGRFIKNIFAVLIMLVILQPIVKFDFDEIVFSPLEGKNDILYQKDYIDYVNNKKVQFLEDDFENTIKQLGVNDATVEILYDYCNEYEFKVKKVYVNLENAVIVSDIEHIDIIEEIKDKLASHFLVDKNVVVVNG